MEEGKVKQMTPQKKEFSLEEMTNIAHQLQEQLVQLKKQSDEQIEQLKSTISHLNMSNVFKRLDYLFKVIENNKMFDDSFVTNAIQEIMDIMTPEKEEVNTQE